jgi:hypothetical protein
MAVTMQMHCFNKNEMHGGVAACMRMMMITHIRLMLMHTMRDAMTVFNLSHMFQQERGKYIRGQVSNHQQKPDTPKLLTALQMILHYASSTPAGGLRQQQPCSPRCSVAAAAGCWGPHSPRATAALTGDLLQLLLLLLTHHRCRAAAAAAATAALPPVRQEGGIAKEPYARCAPC